MTIHNAGGRPPLDTTITVATPENVAFDFRLAGPFPRFIALIVDIVLISVVFLAAGILLGILGSVGIGLFLIGVFFSWWGYGGLMETLCNGQTLGKKALGIRVVTDSGLGINGAQGILRNVLRSADLLPPFFPGVLAMLMTSRFQRLGDLAAETIVVIDGGRSSPRPPKSNQKTDEIRLLIPAHFRPDNALIETLAAYVGRRNDVSASRRRELAQTLAPHFIRTWSLPPKTDPDMVLCAIYDRATMDQVKLDQQSTSRISPLLVDNRELLTFANQQRSSRDELS